jgi:hypothetical protein
MLEALGYSDKQPGKNTEEGVSDQNAKGIKQHIVNVDDPVGIPQNQ